MTSRDDDRAIDGLLRRVASALEREGKLEDQPEAFLRWLADDLAQSRTSAQRVEDEQRAERFAARVLETQRRKRLNEPLTQHVMRQVKSTVVVPVSQAVEVARRAGCAPLLELSAAAGQGRALWDEPCEDWLELPAAVPKGKYLAVGVRGDSMEPVLDRRDVILVHLEARPTVDDIVLAEVSGDGYVVKRVAAWTPERVELASLNNGYPPIVVRGDEITVVGVVIARVNRTT